MTRLMTLIEAFKAGRRIPMHHIAAVSLVYPKTKRLQGHVDSSHQPTARVCLVQAYPETPIIGRHVR